MVININLKYDILNILMNSQNIINSSPINVGKNKIHNIKLEKNERQTVKSSQDISFRWACPCYLHILYIPIRRQQ